MTGLLLSYIRTVQVYTDGACSGNPGPGGWAWATVDGRSASGGELDSTNQRMELTAVLEAVKGLTSEPLEIYSDSTYVVNCFNDGWYKGWLNRGWKTSQRKPVANRDLWEPLIDLYLERINEISLVWVKGHSGNKMNDAVDAMAVAEVDKIKKAQKSTPVVDKTPVPWPVDRAIAVIGVGDGSKKQKAAVANAVAQVKESTDIIISGLRRGSELTIAELAHKSGISLGVVLPFADPVGHWSRPDQERFLKAVESAQWVVTLKGVKSQSVEALEARDLWLQSAVLGVIVVDNPQVAKEFDAAGVTVISISSD